MAFLNLRALGIGATCAAFVGFAPLATFASEGVPGQALPADPKTAYETPNIELDLAPNAFGGGVFGDLPKWWGDLRQPSYGIGGNYEKIERSRGYQGEWLDDEKEL